VNAVPEYSVDDYLSRFEGRAGLKRDWCARIPRNVSSSSRQEPQTRVAVVLRLDCWRSQKPWSNQMLQWETLDTPSFFILHFLPLKASSYQKNTIGDLIPPVPWAAQEKNLFIKAIYREVRDGQLESQSLGLARCDFESSATHTTKREVLSLLHGFEHKTERR
jgi:hypothetical protein